MQRKDNRCMLYSRVSSFSSFDEECDDFESALKAISSPFLSRVFVFIVRGEQQREEEEDNDVVNIRNTILCSFRE